MESIVTTMYATHLVWDKATRVTYMDTVTTSLGRVALRNPHMVATLSGPTVEKLAEEDLAEGCTSLTSLKELGGWPPRNKVIMVSLTGTQLRLY